MSYWIALAFAVFSNIFANIAFKLAMARVVVSSDMTALRILVSSPWVWSGVMSGAVLVVCYLFALRGIEASVAYPVVTGLAMVGIAAIGALGMGEVLSAWKIIGISLIVSGIVVLSSSSSTV